MSIESTHRADAALPDEIVQAIAIANATITRGQPAILANLALAEQVFLANLRQQNAVALQQACQQLSVAIVARCAASILQTDVASTGQIKPMLDTLLPLLERLHPVAAPVPAPVRS